MRITAGVYRGRNLVDSSKFKSLRPTTDMSRQAIFNILLSGKNLKEINFKIENSSILDLCCGTGSLSFEAISRGAKSATLIDNNSTHLKLAEKNSQLLKIENKVEIILADVKNIKNNNQFFDLIFFDPPYNENYQEILENLIINNWIQEKSLLVIEYGANSNIQIECFTKLKILEKRNYGKSYFAFLIKV